ncbi:MAG: 6-pyruvoyl-tetrahydropterin synthase-related protein, partial [Chloroflexota bacterium]
MSLSSRPGNTGRWWETPATLLLITSFGALLVTPLLRWTSNPCTDDGHLLYYRLAALRHAWESGSAFSRWFPDVAFGYGYPFFIYREAPPLYLGLIPHLLGFPLPAAMNIFYALCILAAGWFMFLWVRDVFDVRAGLVSAVAYMSAPFLLTDVFIRGIQPETMALALFPFICWIGRRFIISGSPGTLLASAGGIALLALSHNISTLLFVPFLAVYLLLAGKLQQIEWRTLLARWALILVLGLGLSAFYLGPALMELDEITINQSINNRNNNFRFNFATIDELLAPVSPEDPTLLNPPFLLRIGLVPAGFALLGLASVLWNKSFERRGHIFFMALATGVLLLMSLEVTLPLWERLPLIRFVQFPWRFVGRAALPIAFLAGAPFAYRDQIAQRFSRARPILLFLPVLAVVLLLTATLPQLYPSFCQSEPFPTINDVHLYERNTGMVGIDPTGSYFPVTVQSRPEGSPLEEDYAAGRTPQRFDESILPPNTQITDIEYSPTGATIALHSPEPFNARYLTFAFPGWAATIDGQRVPITPSVPEGLITFSVPAGSHTIDIRWQSTPTRSATLVISILAFIGLIVATIVLYQKQKRIMSNPGAAGQATPAGTDMRAKRWMGNAFWLFLLVAVAFLAFKLLIVDRTETSLRRVSPPPVAYPSDLQAAELRLEGHNLSQEHVEAGGTFEIDLAWRATASPAAEYQSNIWLVGPEGLPWSDKETARPRTYEATSPTTLWLPGQWAWDSREVQVLPGTPPGTYDIVLTLFDRADLQPITLTSPEGTVVGPTDVIGDIVVDLPKTTPEFTPQYRRQEPVDGLTLLGFNQDRQVASPGQQMLLTLFWEKPIESPSPSGELELTLRDKEGNIAQRWMFAPVRADYPVTEWQVGERVRGQHLLRLAASLEDGDYRFYLAGKPLGEIIIQAPDRLYIEPDFETAIQADFGGLIELVGYSIETDNSDPQSPITIKLVWRGNQEMPTSYRVFVHLVDEDGQILSQSDAEPADWTRPTTGWAIGEYVVDQHHLTRPAGEPLERLWLRVGLYDAQTNERLGT